MTIKDRIHSDGAMIVRPRSFTCACGSPRLYLKLRKNQPATLSCFDCPMSMPLQVIAEEADDGKD